MAPTTRIGAGSLAASNVNGTDIPSGIFPRSESRAIQLAATLLSIDLIISCARGRRVEQRVQATD